MGECQVRGDCKGGKSIGRDATRGWRLEPVTDNGLGRLRNG